MFLGKHAAEYPVPATALAPTLEDDVQQDHAACYVQVSRQSRLDLTTIRKPRILESDELLESYGHQVSISPQGVPA